MTIQINHTVFKALSEVIRLRIIALLFSGELCVCDLIEILTLPQSTISRHLAILKQSGLIIDRREKKWVYYRLNDSEVSGLNMLKNLLAEISRQTPYKDDIERLQTYKLTNPEHNRC